MNDHHNMNTSQVKNQIKTGLVGLLECGYGKHVKEHLDPLKNKYPFLSKVFEEEGEDDDDTSITAMSGN